MSYYHISNINIDKENNNISADLADSCWTPIEYFHCDKLFDDDTFEEKYANFIYNAVSGNFHPNPDNIYSKLVMNNLLRNYYDDANDIGILKTYNKYKDVINGILTSDLSKCVKLESERTLNPEYYYALTPINIDEKSKNNGDYYINQKGDLFCFTEKGLMSCSTSENQYGYPLLVIYDDKEKYIEYNDFLKDDSKGLESEVQI